MKVISRPIPDWLKSNFFYPLRTKKDVILLLMNTIKYLSWGGEAENDAGARVMLRIHKHSRLFFFDDHKSFSISFPFTVQGNERHAHFSTKEIEDVDSRITSKVISLLNDDDFFDSREFSSVFDPLVELDDDSSGFWPFLLNLLSYETGYLRYDFDEARENEEFHPLFHYDIFYSGNATCKVGLKQAVSREQLIDFLDTSTRCHFLEH